MRFVLAGRKRGENRFLFVLTSLSPAFPKEKGKQKSCG